MPTSILMYIIQNENEIPAQIIPNTAYYIPSKKEVRIFDNMRTGSVFKLDEPAPGRYLVSFNGVGSSTQATSPFTVALYQNEVELPETITTAYSTAANDVGTLTFSTIVNVLPSCAAINNRVNLQVVATSANSGTMANANLVIYRLR